MSIITRIDLLKHKIATLGSTDTDEARRAVCRAQSALSDLGCPDLEAYASTPAQRRQMAAEEARFGNRYRAGVTA